MKQGKEPEYLYLTTTGRRSGQPRMIEIWFAEVEGRFYLIAEHGARAHWVRNIQADPRVKVRVGDRQFHGRGRTLEEMQDGTLHRAVSERFDEKYGWSDGLIVELSPES